MIRTGAQLAAASGWKSLQGSRVGVFSNPTGVLPDTTHIVDSMAATLAPGTVVAAFGPEHGFRGSAQATGSEGDTTDPRTGIPIYDAYAADTAKLRTLFTKARLDTIVFDIQDIGARYYTYIWTLYDLMAAAAGLDLRVVVLDRPNPVGGRADGGLVAPGLESTVGERPILQQHGMTVGELAALFDGAFLPEDPNAGRRSVELEVIPVEGWRPSDRAQAYGREGQPWIPPSPNIPTPDSALVYAGSGLFEGTELSRGRGTTRPFEVIGAPYLDFHLADRLNALELPGVEFREAYFTPTFSTYAGTQCCGVEVHVTDLWRFRPVQAAVAILVEVHRYAGFEWRKVDDPDPYWIDRLAGSTGLRTLVEQGAGVDEILAAWRSDRADFERLRRAYLRYPGHRA